MKPLDLRDERGVMAVLFAIVLTAILMMTAAVWDVGNWWTHRKHLQTKADAAVFAGGDVWGFPCGSDSDVRIVAEARKYVGPHMGPGNQDFTTQTTFNPQIGGTPGENIHVVLNGADWWDDDPDPDLDPADATTPAGLICEAKMLDAKVTEENNLPLFGMIPFFPDIKRRARVEIQEVEGLTGLLPIAVRFPKPESSAAVFYDETNGNILSAKYFSEADVFGLPAGLRGYTTADDWAVFSLPGSKVGVVIATSFRPACDATADPPITTNCFDNTVGPTVNDLCRQGNGTVQCFYATETGSSQTVQSGLHFIRGYDNNPNNGTGPPVLRGAWLQDAEFSAACPANGYFNATTSTCRAALHVQVDVGALLGEYPNSNPPPPEVMSPLRAGDVEVKYMLGRADDSSFCNYGATCELQPEDPDAPATSTTFSTTGSADSLYLPITRDSRQNGVAIQIRIRNAQNSPNEDCRDEDEYNNSCRWWYTANGDVPENQADSAAEIVAAPVQRSFMGDVDDHTTISGPIKFVRITSGTLTGPDGSCLAEAFDEMAASQPIGQQRCFVAEMGLRGGIAKDQDEPPVVLNLSGTSQSALLDCDPNVNHGQIAEEIVKGCQTPLYAPNRFDTNPLCPAMTGPVQWFQTPKPPPHDDWPPFTCVFTRTQAAAQQMLMGFIERITGSFPAGPCPTDTSHFNAGRNYWHDANNSYADAEGTDLYTFAQDNPPPFRGNRLGLGGDDPRLVSFFMTAYDSFNGEGNQVYPIVRFGSFYVTGFGRVTGAGFIPSWSDPCTTGNSDPSLGAGSKPPPDFDFSEPGSYIWGHFVDNVVPSPSATPSGRLCQPGTGMPCVAVLVE